MKVMSARDAKNHFGEFIEDAADTALSDFLLDKEPGYDGWLFDKVAATMRKVDSGETAIYEHQDAMAQLRKRLKARVA